MRIYSKRGQLTPIKGKESHHCKLTAIFLVANTHLKCGFSPLSSPTPEPSTPTLADLESSPPPPARLSAGKKHVREQVVTIPRPTRQTRSAAQRENTARRKELDEV